MASAIEGKVKRSLFYTFLNIGTKDNPKWAREGKNVSELTINMNPQTTTAQDITQDTADTEVTGYQPSTAFSKHVDITDPIHPYINNIRRRRKVLSDAHSQILNVEVFDKNEDGSYPAELQDVSIQVDTVGGAAADPFTLAYGYNYRGDAKLGKVTITNGEIKFTEDSETADISFLASGSNPVPAPASGKSS